MTALFTPVILCKWPLGYIGVANTLSGEQTADVGLVCKPEADAQNVSDEDFGRAMAF